MQVYTYENSHVKKYIHKIDDAINANITWYTVIIKLKYNYYSVTTWKQVIIYSVVRTRRLITHTYDLQVFVCASVCVCVCPCLCVRILQKHVSWKYFFCVEWKCYPKIFKTATVFCGLLYGTYKVSFRLSHIYKSETDDYLFKEIIPKILVYMTNNFGASPLQ